MTCMTDNGFDITVFKGSPSGKIVASTTHKDSLKPDEVLLKITHAGLCGTDLHYKTSGIVLSHEGVGIVQQIGPEVTNFKIGDRAGWGYLHNSCGHCDECLSGNEIFCSERAMYGEADKDQGGFASHAIWKAGFLFHIPDEISSSEAAPLMCAGATVFNAMHLYGMIPTDRVGIIGVGGLGHLAIQFAAKMGCQVVVFSGTKGKENEAKKLGASEFYETKDMQALEIGAPLKHLFVTTSQQPDWNCYLNTLAPHAKIYPLTVSADALSLPYMQLVVNGITLQGSICPSRGTHIKMLRFAALHHIKPIIEEFPLTEAGIEEAIQKLENGEVRYRAVLVAQNDIAGKSK
ncbi:chaperonin 10-like protein [Suillus fuscotomentosus]|uniref:Chaperonin 10-like protein n=1 Tax=Suillus fuscotomentosus TaxID=1912939 RepID=A0AAD4HG71_9AGAM|nr:chaperonin 10-like protein [Suillus fuscotomentosus]KAG1895332.1 chaperonin 10-like protein [Suillus fuscotomentosus]